jgi:glycosyltransferase involved in cell wall biosynthesis
MKLCIVTENVIKRNGQGRVNYEIAWEALRRGHPVTLVANRVAPELEQNSQVNWIFIPVEGVPTQLLSGVSFAWRSANWLRRHRPTVDIVMANGGITWAQGDLILVPFVHSAWLRSPLHTSRVRRDFYGAYQWLYTALNARWEKNAFHQAQVVVAVSHRVKKELLDIHVPEEKLQVIWCGVDLQEFSPGYSDRKKYDLPEQVPLALFVGDIRINRKNLDSVLRAMTRTPELHLAIMAAEDSSYPQLAKELGLDTRIHFLEPQLPVSEVMRSVDFFVFPSRYEPYGLVVIEAMASGLPVITTVMTGAAEIVTPDCGIVLSDSEDIDALAKALSSLVHDPELRNRMGTAARTVAEQHSWTSMAQTYVDIFEELSKK